MLAPETTSINSELLTGDEVSVSVPVQKSSNEKAPLISKHGLFKSISQALKFSRNTEIHNTAYVEFDVNVSNESSGRTLGTFSGVFSPVALSMFSALLFLRVGFIVGNAGLLITLLQFAIAYAILLFTVASVCAISTNGAVEGGGAYFMISRTLGPEFGGSIGTLFFLANIVSSALYITGCAEGLVENFGPSGYLVDGTLPDGHWWRFLYCTLLNIVNLIVCLIGAGMFAKTSVVILGIVSVSLLSVIVSFIVKSYDEIPIPEGNTLVQNATYHVNGSYTGFLSKTLEQNLYSNYGYDYTSDGKAVSFASVFGVLFSGVTGIMAGANMSGELRNPSHNIPRGTLSAVGFTFVCYIILSIFAAATCSQFLLQNNFLFMLPINVWPPFVTIGILTATFSASLSNIIGSSRVLEALAKDNIFGSLLGFVNLGIWRGNPVAAVFISWILVEMILLIGSLNLIAQINSVLFLLSYCATNLACLGLELASAPNFRPSFKYFTWHTAFFGLIGTLVMMFLISSIYASSSIILCLVLVIILHLFSPSRGANWGSISQALIFHQVRKYLLLLDSRKDHVKFWRPQMLLMVGNPRSSCPLIQFVNDMKKSGLYVIGHVKVGQFHHFKTDPIADEYTHWLSLVDHLKVKAFVELTVAASVREGLQHMIRMSGVGAMKPNTIVLGFYDSEVPIDFFENVDSHFQTSLFKNTWTSDNKPLFDLRSPTGDKNLEATEYVGMIADTLKMRKNICLCRHFHLLNKKDIGKHQGTMYIDVWPINFFKPNSEDPFDTTSLFMLQLACVLNMVPGWKNLQVRVFLCENQNKNNGQSSSATCLNNESRLKQLLQELRIAASIQQLLEWKQLSNVINDTSVLDTAPNGSRAYIMSVNQLIRQHSEQSAATFIYLPSPQITSELEEEGYIYPQFLQLLTELTENLPPTILVHGIHAVTSTTL